MSIATSSQIEAFITEFRKQALETGIYGEDRSSYKADLDEIGFTRKQRDKTILNLTFQNYLRGPVADRDRPGEVYFFS